MTGEIIAEDTIKEAQQSSRKRISEICSLYEELATHKTCKLN